MKFEWEQIGELTQRAKVIGGWLVRTHDFDKLLKLLSFSTVFVADPFHQWKIEEEQT